MPSLQIGDRIAGARVADENASVPKNPVCQTVHEERISVRVPRNRFRDTKQRLRCAAKIAGVDESTLVLAAVEGACEFIEKHGSITLPMKVSEHTLEETVERLEGLCRAVPGE